MKLYSIQASNNCRRANAVIQHLGLDVELVEPSLPAGDLKKPDYVALNPNSKVPTLVDGDFNLWESRAIMHYLAAQKPGNSLLPSDPKAQADILRWQFWETAHLSVGTAAFAFENLFKRIFMNLDPDPAALAAGEKSFRTFAPVLDKHLAGRSFLVGDGVTLADFSVGACFSYAAVSGIPWGDYANVRAWCARLDEIPAWKNTAPRLA